MTTTPSHAPFRDAESGCLALADISGYTSYLAGAELEHAQDVLEDLTGTVIANLAPPMRFAKLEGDAAFAYAIGERIDASMLLDTVDRTYYAFRRRLDAIDRATQCDCNACVLIPRLDLKFVVHHGRFSRGRIAGNEELSGTDVIVVHRLLKNSVAEAIGHGGYAFFTDEVVRSMGLDAEAVRFRPHVEHMDDGAMAHGWVEDLHQAWRVEQERRRVRVAPDDASLVLVNRLPAPPPVVWTYLTDPQFRPGWQPGVQRVEEQNPSGRRGAGTTNHCIHGKGAAVEEILDWRPFDYLTMDMQIPAPVLGKLRITYDLEEVDGETRVTETVAAPRGGLVQRVAWRLLRGSYVGFHDRAYRALESALAERSAA